MKGTQWRVAMIAMIAGLLGGVVSSRLLVTIPVMAQAVPPQSKVLRTERLEILDHTGTTRALFQIRADGLPQLFVGDVATGEGASVSPMGIGIMHGKNVVNLGPLEHARDAVGLTIISGGSSMLIAGPGKGTTSIGLSIQNPNGQVLLAGEAPSLTLCDLLKKPRAVIYLSDYGMPMIGLFDQGGQTLWSTP